MYHTIYLSSATVPFTQEQLDALLKQSRENNSKLGITGILFYKDGNFLQVIEGEKDTVRTLFNTISNDSRHRGIISLVSEEISQREFPNWSMAFRDLERHPEQMPEGFHDFLNQPPHKADLTVFSKKVRAFLRTFSQ